MENHKFTVIILAGDRGPDDPVAKARGEKRKALTPLLRRPMIEYVIDAAKRASYVGEVMVVANQVNEIRKELPRIPNLKWFEGDYSPASSILKAMNHHDLKYPLLVMTADNPLLTRGRIDKFCEASLATSASVTVGLVSKTVVKAAYPDMRRTYIKLGSEGYSGCNLFCFKTATTKDVARFWMGVEQNRKNPLKVIGAFGLGNMLRALIGALDLSSAMEQASKRLGHKVAAVLLDQAEASIDVDRPSHIPLVEEILQTRRDRNQSNKRENEQ